jgi:RND family efflux transporter MFP subunit
MIRRSNTTFVLATLALLASCQQEDAPPETEIRPVLSMVAASSTADATNFTGSVQSRFIAEMGFQVGGRLVHRNADVGDLVLAGQKIAELDPLSYQLQLKIAQAELASATAQRQNAVANEDREQRLAAQNVTSKADLEAAQQARESADANVDNAKAKVAKAREQLDNTVVVATFAGVVTEVAVEPGQIVQAGQTVLTLARPDVREAVVDVPERIGRSLGVNTAFQVVSQARPALTATGHVREIAPLADSTTRTLRVRITLVNPPAGFRLGTIVTATLSTPVKKAILLPASAVLERDGKTFVWLVDEGKNAVATRQVEITPDGNAVRILKGLSLGDRVVTVGVHSLTEGQKVKLIEAAQ